MTAPTRLSQAVRTLEPGQFAVVMATGIVSTALQAHHLYALSVPLMWIAGIVYAVLVVANVARIVLYSRAFRADMIEPTRSFTMTRLLLVQRPQDSGGGPAEDCSRAAGFVRGAATSGSRE